MDFQLLLLDNAALGEKRADIVALIALQLDDLAVLGMIDNGAVAGELLLERAHELLLVELLRYALHSSERLAAVALLDADVHETTGRIDVRFDVVAGAR